MVMNTQKRIFRRVLDLDITSSSAQNIISSADNCKLKQGLSIDSTNINETCPGGDNHEPECTSWEQPYIEFIQQYPGNEKTVSVLWIGSKLSTNRSFAWYDNGINMQELYTSNNYYNIMSPALTHELAHQFGAPDHYHEILEDGTCRGEEKCSTCGQNSRPSSCMMNYPWISNIDTREENTLFCLECVEDMKIHIIDHH